MSTIDRELLRAAIAAWPHEDGIYSNEHRKGFHEAINIALQRIDAAPAADSDELAAAPFCGAIADKNPAGYRCLLPPDHYGLLGPGHYLVAPRVFDRFVAARLREVGQHEPR